VLGPFVVIQHRDAGGAFGTQSTGHTRILGIAFNPFDNTVFNLNLDGAPDGAHPTYTEYRFFHDL
jgi:hypothetical protein